MLLQSQLTTTLALTLPAAVLIPLAQASPFVLPSLSPRGKVPNHPVSHIGDFTPSTIAPYEAGDTNEDVAICLAIKDEYHMLTEWLVHHYNHHGIRRFYIMDDGSNPQMSSYDYQDFVDPRVITHRYMEPSERLKDGQQTQMYSQCISEFGSQHKWMGFIDTDEFLEVKAPYTLHGMLSDLENIDTIGALAINWLNHNWGGLDDRPQGQGIRETFTECISDSASIEGGGNSHIKSFLKLGAGLMSGPHEALLKDGMVTVGENGDVVTQKHIRDPPTRDKIVLHHYATRSRTEYEVKVSRGDATMPGNGNRGERFWTQMAEAPYFDCPEMAAYNPSRTEYEVKVSRGDATMAGSGNRGERFWTEMAEAPYFDCPEMTAYDP